MLRLGAALLAVVAVSCASSSVAGTEASPSRIAQSPVSPPVATESPAQSGSPLAVMVHRAGLGEPYIVQLVGSGGAGGPAVHPLSRTDKTFYTSTPCPAGAICADAQTAAYAMPETSVSSTHVYFLDGETQVRALAPDGSVTDIKNIQAPANSQVMFAVSPDDSRIAVAIITLATTEHPPQSFTEQMYVEDLRTTTNRVVLYTSTTQPEWPLAWRLRALVVALGGPDMWGSGGNPYGATGYEVLDPSTGAVQATLDCAFGHVVHAGSVCLDGGCPDTSRCQPTTAALQRWDGRKVPLPLPVEATYVFTAFDYTQLSPDPSGSLLAADVVIDPKTSGDTKTVVVRDGKVVFTTLVGAPQGWLDGTHLIVSNTGSVYIDDVVTGDEVMMTGLQSIPTQGMPRLAGVLPSSLD